VQSGCFVPQKKKKKGEEIMASYSAPITKLKTDRKLWKIALISIVTFGIYALYDMSRISSDINTAASKHDGKKTMHFILMCLLCLPTFGIAGYVWYHKLSNRIGKELTRRDIAYDFGAVDYWLWFIILGGTIVCPLIYMYKLYKAMNLLNAHYNNYG
jgi:hypothetical protein